MWAYSRIKRGERRKDLWIWMALVKGMNDIGGRDESPFSRLMDRCRARIDMRWTLIWCTSGCLGIGMC